MEEVHETTFFRHKESVVYVNFSEIFCLKTKKLNWFFSFASEFIINGYTRKNFIKGW